MSRIPEDLIAAVVSEASTKMADPSYASGLVDTWVRTQHAASQYLSAYAVDLGGAQEVVNVVVHAALIGECFKRHNGRTPGTIEFEDLDRVGGDDPDAELKKCQPSLKDYVDSNIEQPKQKEVLTLLALALDSVE